MNNAPTAANTGQTNLTDNASTDIAKVMRALATNARSAAAILANNITDAKNMACREAALALGRDTNLLLTANAKDATAAETAGLSGPMLDRLKLDPVRIAAMANSL
ncbi:MAG TPA: gamma-glutamyl-phosphate reductase, partial [Sneathiellales bacterium]|nr:gamma-glutamyl-phosphate reductase [Sneathiellales bacterium]